MRTATRLDGGLRGCSDSTPSQASPPFRHGFSGRGSPGARGRGHHVGSPRGHGGGHHVGSPRVHLPTPGFPLASLPPVHKRTHSLNAHTHTRTHQLSAHNAHTHSTNTRTHSLRPHTHAHSAHTRTHSLLAHTHTRPGPLHQHGRGAAIAGASTAPGAGPPPLQSAPRTPGECVPAWVPARLPLARAVRGETSPGSPLARLASRSKPG